MIIFYILRFFAYFVIGLSLGSSVLIYALYRDILAIVPTIFALLLYLELKLEGDPYDRKRSERVITEKE